MSDSSQPYNCLDFERDLHLVIGGDLDPQAQVRAQQHLASCSDCVPRAARAGDVRQLYFEAAGRVSGAPIDAWPKIREALRSEGRLAGVPAGAGMDRPTEGAQAESEPRAKRPTALEAAALAEVLPAREFIATGEGARLDSGRRPWRGVESRAWAGLLVGAAAAAAVIFLRPSGAVDPSPNRSGEDSSALANAAPQAVTPAEQQGSQQTNSIQQLATQQLAAQQPITDPASAGLRQISPTSSAERLALQSVLYSPVPAPGAIQPTGPERLASFSTSGVELR